MFTRKEQEHKSSSTSFRPCTSIYAKVDTHKTSAKKTEPKFKLVEAETNTSDRETENWPHHVFRPPSDKGKDVLPNRLLYIDDQPSSIEEEINEGKNKSLPNNGEDNQGTKSVPSVLEATRNRRLPNHFGIDEYIVRPE